MTRMWSPPAFGRGVHAAEAWNAVVTLGGRPVELAPGGPVLTWTLTDPPAPADPPAYVRLPGADMPVTVIIREFPFDRFCGVQLSASEVAGLPQGLRHALTEGMVSAIGTMTGIEVLTAGEILSDAQPSPSEEDRAGMQWFGIRIEHPDDGMVALDVAAPRAVASEAASWLAAHHRVLGDAVQSAVPLPADFSLGSITLPIKDLPVLEPGVVIVMARRPDDQCDLRVAGRLYRFERAPEGWRSLWSGDAEVARSLLSIHGSDPVMRESDDPEQIEDGIGAGVEDDEGETPDNTAPEQPSVALGELRVALDFDIGRQTVALSELARWQPGTIAELDPPQPADGLEVTIRSSGEIVGRGELVRLDERVAVRVTHLFLRR